MSRVTVGFVLMWTIASAGIVIIVAVTPGAPKAAPVVWPPPAMFVLVMVGSDVQGIKGGGRSQLCQWDSGINAFVGHRGVWQNTYDYVIVAYKPGFGWTCSVQDWSTAVVWASFRHSNPGMGSLFGFYDQCKPTVPLAVRVSAKP